MKHSKHENRKSFKKFGLARQLTKSITTPEHIKITGSRKGAFGNARKNNV